MYLPKMRMRWCRKRDKNYAFYKQITICVKCKVYKDANKNIVFNLMNLYYIYNSVHISAVKVYFYLFIAIQVSTEK